MERRRRRLWKPNRTNNRPSPGWLYAAAGKVPPLEPYRPWLEEHKVQAIAITAAILFGLSLLLFPPEEGGAEPAAPEEGPCAGYERTEDLP